MEFEQVETPSEAPILPEETPVEETPVEEPPVEETPVEETPVEEPPVEEPEMERDIQEYRKCFVTDKYRTDVEIMTNDYSDNLLKLNCRKFNLNVHDISKPTIGLLEEELIEYYPEIVPL